jgi:hypothetical protein
MTCRSYRELTIERTIYIRVNDRLTKNGQACFYLVISTDGAVGVCRERMKALTETSKIEPARGNLGFAGLAEDITGNAGLPAQVDRSVFATPGELVIRRFRRRRLHRIPSRRMRFGGNNRASRSNAFGCRAAFGPGFKTPQRCSSQVRQVSHQDPGEKAPGTYVLSSVRTEKHARRKTPPKNRKDFHRGQ